MTQKNQDDMTNTELAKLIETVAVNLAAFQENVDRKFKKIDGEFAEVRGEFAEIKQEARSFRESTDERFEKLEETVLTKIDFDIRFEKIEAGLFTEDQKESVLDTMKLVNTQLEANVLGKGSLTLTRPEYDELVDFVHLPNRFATA